MKVTILGCGAYALSLSLMFYKNTKNITLWTKVEEEKESLLKTRKNEKALPGIQIPEEIKVTSNLKEAIKDTSLIVFAIPAKFVRQTLGELQKDYQGTSILIATKGIENETGNLMHEVVKECLKTTKISVISGPTFAIDMANFVPTGLTLAAEKPEEEKIRSLLENDTLTLETSSDLTGTEICGSIKNIMAIANGILDGMGYPISTKAMFLTKALNQIKSLLPLLGGEEHTITTLSGFGDLILTCMSEKSRNFSFGKMIGERKSKEEIMTYRNQTTIEGLYTLESFKKLCEIKRIDFPFLSFLESILNGEKDPDALISYLMNHKSKEV